MNGPHRRVPERVPWAVVANTGSASGLAYEKTGIFENLLVFGTQVTPEERVFSHMRLDGTELEAVSEVPLELVFPIIRLAPEPASASQTRFVVAKRLLMPCWQSGPRHRGDADRASPYLCRRRFSPIILYPEAEDEEADRSSE